MKLQSIQSTPSTPISHVVLSRSVIICNTPYTQPNVKLGPEHEMLLIHLIEQVALGVPEVAIQEDLMENSYLHMNPHCTIPLMPGSVFRCKAGSMMSEQERKWEMLAYDMTMKVTENTKCDPKHINKLIDKGYTDLSVLTANAIRVNSNTFMVEIHAPF